MEHFFSGSSGVFVFAIPKLLLFFSDGTFSFASVELGKISRNKYLPGCPRIYKTEKSDAVRW